MSDDKDRAEAYRMAAEYLQKMEMEGSVSMLIGQANRLDPPADTLDTSLRGWVLVTDDLSGSTVMMALESGLTFWPEPGYPAVRPWSVVEKEGWTVRALTSEDIGYRVRHYTEFTAEEKERVRDCHLLMADIVDLVIDIATRQEDV